MQKIEVGIHVGDEYFWNDDNVILGNINRMVSGFCCKWSPAYKKPDKPQALILHWK